MYEILGFQLLERTILYAYMLKLLCENHATRKIVSFASQIIWGPFY